MAVKKIKVILVSIHFSFVSWTLSQHSILLSYPETAPLHKSSSTVRFELLRKGEGFLAHANYSLKSSENMASSAI